MIDQKKKKAMFTNNEDELNFKSPTKIALKISESEKENYRKLAGRSTDCGFGSTRKFVALNLIIPADFMELPVLVFKVVGKNHTTINGNASHDITIDLLADVQPQTVTRKNSRGELAIVRGSIKEFTFALTNEKIRSLIDLGNKVKLIAEQEYKCIVVYSQTSISL